MSSPPSRPVRHLPGKDGGDTFHVWSGVHELWPDRDLHRMTLEALALIALRVPARLSMRQVLAFYFVVEAAANGRQITLTDLKAYFVQIDGEGAGQSLAKSFQIFFAPTRQEPQGLNWVDQEPDEDDRRRKFLRLTAYGAEFAKEIADTLKAKPTYGAPQDER